MIEPFGLMTFVTLVQVRVITPTRYNELKSNFFDFEINLKINTERYVPTLFL